MMGFANNISPGLPASAVTATKEDRVRGPLVAGGSWKT
jgi:hypothetical protein